MFQVWHRRIPTESHLNEAQRRKIHTTKMLTVKMFVMVTLLFIILWLPNTMLYILLSLQVDIYRVRYANIVVDMAVLFSLINSCVNFFVYAMWDKKFRRSFIKLIRLKTHDGRLDGTRSSAINSSGSAKSSYRRTSSSSSGKYRKSKNDSTRF